MAVTVEQLLKSINDHAEEEYDPDADEYGIPKSEIAWGYFDDTTNLSVGELSRVKAWGGEGEGDSIGFVAQLTGVDGDIQYFEMDGYYNSWDGSDWSEADIVEVTPKLVTVTEYVRKR